MPTYTLTIAGVPKAITSGTLRLSRTLNGKDTMALETVSWNGTYRPPDDAEILYLKDAERLFGGVVDTPAERGLFASHGGRALVNQVGAVDFNALVDRRIVNGIIVAGTLKDALLVLVNYLTPYGVTLDPAQVTGPAVPLMTIPQRPLRDILDELSTITGYVWEIDYTRVLRMFLPGTLTAPFNIVPATDPTVLVGDVTVEAAKTEYANRIILVAGSGTHDVSRTFIGDSVTRVFPLVINTGTFPVVTVNGAPVEVGTYGVDTHLEWTFDGTENAPAIRQLAEAPVGTAHSPLTSADTLLVTYEGRFPFYVYADHLGEQAGPKGLREKQITETKVFDVDYAQALANGYLERYIQTFKQARLPTRRMPILKPGQTLTITIPERNLAGTFMVTDVDTTDTVGGGFHQVVSAVGGTVRPGSWQNWWYQTLGGGGGGTSSGATITPGGGGAVVISSPVSLGGSRHISVAITPATWLPVRDYRTFLAQGTFAGRVRADTWALNAGVTATLRLYNLTDSTVAATSIPVTSTTPVTVMFNVGIVLGKSYRLEVLSSVAGQGVFGIGDLESA